jgi:hypothetical protein
VILMTTVKIDPRHQPIRGREIPAYYGIPYQISLRAIRRGLIDADKDGRVYVSTPHRLDNSPLIVGRKAGAQ